MSETETSSQETVLGPARARLSGTSVAPGLVLGPVHRKDHDLAGALIERVPKDGVGAELARFQLARERARSQLHDLKVRVEGRVDARDARILDAHLTYLDDSAFISDVEHLITGEQLRLEAAIAKVIGDFDRIFRLVENETLRQSAVDLRDVGIRVLRNLDSDPSIEIEPPDEYILVARELNIVDMFNLSNEHVLGVVTEEGGLTSHAAIFARSMRIPTITGVAGLLDTVREGDFVILDAAEGTLRVNPDEPVVRQYRSAPARGAPFEGRIPELVSTRDGERVVVSASCGNLAEVGEATELGFHDVGLYRTELQYLVENSPPALEVLEQHYSSVFEAAPERRVTFRLFNVDAGLEVPWLPGHETPTFGRAGVRVLLAHEDLLRRQLQALLTAAAAGTLRVAVPYVTDCGELRRVRQVLLEERQHLRQLGTSSEPSVEVGAVVETPAALLGMRDLAREADFLTVNLDALVHNVLAVDRDRVEGESAFRELHPYVLRALAKLAAVCAEGERELSLFGVSATANLDVLLGLGLRSFGVSPAHAGEFLSEVPRIDLRAARKKATALASNSFPAETTARVESYHHGQGGS